MMRMVDMDCAAGANGEVALNVAAVVEMNDVQDKVVDRMARSRKDVAAVVWEGKADVYQHTVGSAQPLPLAGVVVP